jgi:hypothetical protein
MGDWSLLTMGTKTILLLVCPHDSACRRTVHHGIATRSAMISESTLSIRGPISPNLSFAPLSLLNMIEQRYEDLLRDLQMGVPSVIFETTLFGIPKAL